MVNYELAKKLKDAGFPYTDKSFKTVYPPGVDQIPGTYIGVGMSTVPEQGQVRVPTLSELIEACGKCFIALKQQSTPKGFPFMWAAYGRYEKDIVEYSTTPEEAIANLWLALNKKVE